jgi:hypothetical protein
VTRAAAALALALAIPAARADEPPPDSGLDAIDTLAPGAVPDLAALGVELTPRAFAQPSEHTRVELHGYLRIREEALVNLDLDRGLTPSGAPLFPVPLGGGQVLDGGDLRARTDLAIYPPGAGVAIKARLDLLDNLGWGATPEVGTGRAPTPAASTGQAAFTAIAVKRVWGEVLTPLGILAAGRMGAHWGLGMSANGGDCEECDGGDSADRLALVTPIAGHYLALAYDLSSSGPFRCGARRHPRHRSRAVRRRHHRHRRVDEGQDAGHAPAPRRRRPVAPSSTARSSRTAGRTATSPPTTCPPPARRRPSTPTI